MRGAICVNFTYTSVNWVNKTRPGDGLRLGPFQSPISAKFFGYFRTQRLVRELGSANLRGVNRLHH